MPVTIDPTCFDPTEIMNSGQCFRMIPLDECTYEVIAFSRRVALTVLDDGRIAFDCDEETFNAVWRDYFDLDTDYAAIIDSAPKEDLFLGRALSCARGLRILRQEPWETLCGFILSQRKNIKAIRAGMESLSDAYGTPLDGTHRKAFPTPQRLAACTEAELRQCGLGYRAPYVLDAAQKVASGQLNLDALRDLPDPVLQAALMLINGVGVKIADCVMLFAYRRLARAPVDVWIRRVIDDVYQGDSPFESYGDYAGVYQQYMFILQRNEGQATLAAKKRKKHDLP